jgi:folate-dependent phosphoribosylglycinamide formyltransferase PurN
MRIALLISGGGTTAASIISACSNGLLKGVEPALVIASSADAPGIKRVLDLGMPHSDVVVIDPKTCEGVEDFGNKILSACEERKVEFIGQYGWLCLTPKNVIEKYEGKMTNQHPGPLDPGRPDFGGKGMFGMRVHAARLLFVNKTGRDFWTEATAQRVGMNFDEGAVLHKKQVPILANDTVESLAARALPVEHEVQIEVLSDFATGAVREILRETPLVRPNEYAILEQCKEEAIKLYPKG